MRRWKAVNDFRGFVVLATPAAQQGCGRVSERRFGSGGAEDREDREDRQASRALWRKDLAMLAAPWWCNDADGEVAAGQPGARHVGAAYGGCATLDQTWQGWSYLVILEL